MTVPFQSAAIDYRSSIRKPPAIVLCGFYPGVSVIKRYTHERGREGERERRGFGVEGGVVVIYHAYWEGHTGKHFFPPLFMPQSLNTLPVLTSCSFAAARSSLWSICPVNFHKLTCPPVLIWQRSVTTLLWGKWGENSKVPSVKKVVPMLLILVQSYRLGILH